MIQAIILNFNPNTYSWRQWIATHSTHRKVLSGEGATPDEALQNLYVTMFDELERKEVSEETKTIISTILEGVNIRRTQCETCSGYIYYSTAEGWGVKEGYPEKPGFCDSMCEDDYRE